MDVQKQGTISKIAANSLLQITQNCADLQIILIVLYKIIDFLTNSVNEVRSIQGHPQDQGKSPVNEGFPWIDRASDRSQEKKSNFAGFLGTNSQKNWPILREFHGSFRGKLHQKAIGRKQPILWLFSRQISLEIDRFCADQTSIFNVFLTEVIICSFNNNMLQNQWQSL